MDETSHASLYGRISVRVLGRRFQGCAPAGGAAPFGSLGARTLAPRSCAKELRETRELHGDEKPLTIHWTIDEGRETVTKTFCPPFEHVVDREAD